MDLLRKELAKKAAEQQRLASVKQVNGNGNGGSSGNGGDSAVPKKKFMKRGQIEQLKLQQELAEKQAKEARKAAEEEAARALKLSGHTNTTLTDNGPASPTVLLPLEEVIRRLRKMRKPITLFGEDDAMRRARLKALEDEGLDDLALHGGHDIGNVFLGDRMDDSRYDSDSEEEDEKRASKRQKQSGVGGAGGSGHDVTDTDSDSGSDHGGVTSTTTKPTSGDGTVTTDAGDTATHEHNSKRLMTLPEWIEFAAKKNYPKIQYVAKFFKQILREWEDQLAKRPDSVKRTAAGKVDTMTEKQCKDYMRPFFRRCKRKEVDEDILEHIYRIVKYCEEREYIKAGDQYVQLAVGNAPWPMGVTSVGIHERAARTKIFANNVAHVMNDEFQRKYITSIKRLMTQCQHLYPTDPSKMML